MDKIYILDTNVLLEDPGCIESLRNGHENKIVIPYGVLVELDRLKRNTTKNHLVFPVIDKIQEDQKIEFVKRSDADYSRDETRDEEILKDVVYAVENIYSELRERCVFVSNDKIFNIKLRVEKIPTQEFKLSKPFKSDAELYTGFVEKPDEIVKNCFMWNNGKLWYSGRDEIIDYENKIWGISPRTPHQNAAFTLMTDPNIDLVTIQSPAGLGKTFIALASALQLVFQKQTKSEPKQINDDAGKKRGGKKKTTGEKTKENSQFKKIYIFRPTTVIGEELGFLPGDLDDKIDPYFRPIKDLLLKLHDIRACNRLFVDGDPNKGFDKKSIEFLPITYLRGMNIENAVVIFDEGQNLSRIQMRTFLTRMCENVKCFIVGDTNQIDSPYLNSMNNGLNWCIRKFKDQKNYGHVTLKGSKSRGPITDLVLKTDL